MRVGYLSVILFLIPLVGCDDPAGKISIEETEVVVAQRNLSVYAGTCAVCHGEAGEGKDELFSPSIAGLPTWYVKDQLEQFRSGHRGSIESDIPGQQMRAISIGLTDAQIDAVASEVSRMPAILTEAPRADVYLDAGRYFYANHCMECHRYNGKGEAVFHSAPLISLNRAYLKRQLENYRSGIRGAADDDVYGNKMVEIAKRLSDEEIEMLVQYIGALAHGDDPRYARER